MARTPQGEALTRSYRQQNLALRAGTLAAFLRLWSALDLTRPETFGAWLRAVSLLIRRDRATAAGLASVYYRQFRQSEGIPGTPRILLAGDLPDELVETSMRVTTTVAYGRGRRSGQNHRQAVENAFVQSAGSVTKLVLNAGRDTIEDTAEADRTALGWMRVASPTCCAFCAMLASRGPVYKDDSFDLSDPRFVGRGEVKVHDWCTCSAEPVYSRDTALPETSQRYAQLWADSTTGYSGVDALNAFRRALGASRRTATEPTGVPTELDEAA